MMGLFGGAKGGSLPDLAQLQIMAGAAPGQVNAGGLFGGSRAQAQTSPKALAQPTAAMASGGKGPSFGRVLDGVLGGSTITEVKDAYRAKQAAQAKQQQYLQMVDGLNLSPEEKLVALNDPGEFMKAVATRHAYHAEDGGRTVFNAPGQGGQPMMTQKLVEDGGVYGTQGADGYTQTGQRGMSHAEETTQQRVAAEIDNMAKRLGLDRDQLAEMVRNHKATEGIGAGNLGVRRDEYNARLKGVGGFGTPGVGSVIGPSLGPEWEVNP